MTLKGGDALIGLPKYAVDSDSAIIETVSHEDLEVRGHVNRLQTLLPFMDNILLRLYKKITESS